MVTANISLIRDNKADRQLYSKLKALREEADYQRTTVEAIQLEQRLKSVKDLIAEVVT